MHMREWLIGLGSYVTKHLWTVIAPRLLGKGDKGNCGNKKEISLLGVWNKYLNLNVE